MSILKSIVRGVAGYYTGGLSEAYFQGQDAKKASGQMAAAGGAAISGQERAKAESLEELGTQFEAGKGYLEPYRKSGERAQGKYQAMLRSYRPTELPQFQGQYQDPGAFRGGFQDPSFRGTSDIPEFTGQVDLEQDPGYQFRREQGLSALDRMMAKGGKRMSGQRGMALQQYGQDLASQEYGAAYGRARDEYGIARQREQEQYGRAERGYEREYGAEQARYGRGLQEYGLGVQRAEAGYQRGLGEYGLQYGRAQDIEQQQLGQMGRYAGLAETGRQTAGTLASMGERYAGAGANIRTGAATQIGAAYSGIGQAQAAGTLGQGSAMSSGLAALQYTLGRNQQSGGAGGYGGYGGYPVAGDAYLPAYGR